MQVKRILVIITTIVMIGVLVMSAVHAVDSSECVCRFYGNDRVLLEEVQVDEGAALSFITAPQIVGMRFIHWYLVDAHLNGDAGTKYAFSTPVTSDLYLMPHYEKLSDSTPVP
ncbi:MAG: hypothetical protein Q4E07_00645, partial [Eubacteriales bacterium]|nr:hypothetical protein [Eubacteriales bacterium]